MAHPDFVLCCKLGSNQNTKCVRIKSSSTTTRSVNKVKGANGTRAWQITIAACESSHNKRASEKCSKRDENLFKGKQSSCNPTRLKLLGTYLYYTIIFIVIAQRATSGVIGSKIPARCLVIVTGIWFVTYERHIDNSI